MPYPQQPQDPQQPSPPGGHQPPSLWTDRGRPWIVGLIFLLLSGNFFFQIQVYLLGAGLVLPVLAGQMLGVFIPLLIIFRRNGWDPVRDLKLGPVPWPMMIVPALLAVAALVPTSLLVELSMRLFPGDPERIAMFQEAASGSLLVCFIFHAGHNALALTLMYLSDEIRTEPQPIEAMDWVWLGISLLAWGVLAHRLLVGRRRRGDC